MGDVYCGRCGESMGSFHTCVQSSGAALVVQDVSNRAMRVDDAELMVAVEKLAQERDEARAASSQAQLGWGKDIARIAALTRERDEAVREVTLLRGQISGLKGQLAGTSCPNCGGKINPSTACCDECTAQDEKLCNENNEQRARIAALEKALKDIDSVFVEWQRIANAALAGAVVRLEDDSDEGLKQARQEMRKLLSQ